MTKTAILNTRINEDLKKEVDSILYELGLTASEAVRLFYKQIHLQHGLPFEVKIPNRATIRAMQDADQGKTHKAKSINELFDTL